MKRDDVLRLFGDLIEVCKDLPVPVYPDKSAKQAKVDLVHPMLNALFTRWLVDVTEWKAETAVGALAGIKDERRFDFTAELPDGRHFVLEVQLGNGGRLQTDFDKFKKVHGAGKLAFGAIVYLTRETAKGADSGLAIYETACKSVLRDLAGMPLVVIGLEREGSREVDLSKIPGLVFPSLLGGSGENRELLQHYIASCLLDGIPPCQIVLEEVHQRIVEAHALKHLGKTLAALSADVARILALPDEMPVKALLLAELVTVVQSTWVPAETREAVVQAAEIHKAAAEKARQAELERKRMAKANTPRTDPAAEARRARQAVERLLREQRQIAREIAKATQYAEEAARLAEEAATGPCDKAAEEPGCDDSACQHVDPSLHEQPLPFEVPGHHTEQKPRLRVVRAVDVRAAREAEEARRQVHSPVRPRVLPNTAMGKAFSAAGLR